MKSSEAQPRRRNLGWPLGITIGLVLVCSTNITMVTIAFRNQSARVAGGDAYTQSLKYDAVAAQRAASDKLGWRVKVDPCEFDGETCEVRLSVVDRQGHPVRDLDGTVVARRADDAAFDREARLEAGGGAGSDAGYVAKLDLERGGYYELSMRLSGAPGTYVEDRRVKFEEVQ